MRYVRFCYVHLKRYMYSESADCNHLNTARLTRKKHKTPFQEPVLALSDNTLMKTYLQIFYSISANRSSPKCYTLDLEDIACESEIGWNIELWFSRSLYSRWIMAGHQPKFQHSKNLSKTVVGSAQWDRLQFQTVPEWASDHKNDEPSGHSWKDFTINHRIMLLYKKICICIYCLSNVCHDARLNRDGTIG